MEVFYIQRVYCTKEALNVFLGPGNLGFVAWPLPANSMWVTLVSVVNNIDTGIGVDVDIDRYK